VLSWLNEGSVGVNRVSSLPHMHAGTSKRSDDDTASLLSLSGLLQRTSCILVHAGARSMTNKKTPRSIRPRKGRDTDPTQIRSRLQSLQDKIRACRELAMQYACKAETTTNKDARDEHLRAESKWINAAHSYEFAAQILNTRNPSAH
jgi:hypothetical protein